MKPKTAIAAAFIPFQAVITAFLKPSLFFHRYIMPATNAPIAVITIPIGPVINLSAKPKPRVANAAAFVTPVHTTVAAVAIFDLIACAV